MLSREGFCKALRMIRDQESIDEQFSKALNLVGNGHFVFGTENKYLLALRDVLKEAVNDQYDYIDWWLYEAADDFEIWEADCTMKYCLKEPEALYDFITGTLKPLLLPVTADGLPAFECADQTCFFTAVILADAKILPAHCIPLNVGKGDVIAFKPVEGTNTVSAAGFKARDPAFGRCANPFGGRPGSILSLKRFLVHLV